MVAFPSPRLWAVVIGTAALVGFTSPASSHAQQAAAPQARIAATVGAATDHFFTSGPARLRYRDVGRGDAVILVHGLTRSLEDWIGVGDSLALDHRVIALDLRGFGQSTRFTEPRYFGAEMAADVVRLLDHLRLPRAHMVGHSLGAAVVANVTARYPDRVASASLIAGPFREDTASFARDDDGYVADIERGLGMRRFLQWLFPGMPDSVATALSAETMARNERATVAAVMRSVGALMVPRDRSGALRAPTLVAVGDGDPLMGESRWLASWWPRAQLLVVPEADHLSITRRGEVLAAMRALMQPDAGARPAGTQAGRPGSLRH